MHDKKMADIDRIKYSDGAKVYFDKGYEGYNPDNVQVMRLKKKPHKRELSEKDMQKNSKISKKRVKVEHAIRGVKVFRVAKETARTCDLKKLDEIMFLACCLHNLRIKFSGKHKKLYRA